MLVFGLEILRSRKILVLIEVLYDGPAGSVCTTTEVFALFSFFSDTKRHSSQQQFFRASILVSYEYEYSCDIYKYE